MSALRNVLTVLLRAVYRMEVKGAENLDPARPARIRSSRSTT